MNTNLTSGEIVLGSTQRTLINSLSFYVCWFATAYGVAGGYSWVGPVMIVLYLLLHWLFIQYSRGEMVFILIGGFMGYGADNFFLFTGTVDYLGSDLLGLAPYWMLFVWFSFLSLFHVSLQWLLERWILAAVLGGLGGPLSYHWADTIGAFSLGEPYGQSLLVLAATWGVITPFLFWLSSQRIFDRNST
jgi:hypothetical protein